MSETTDRWKRQFWRGQAVDGGDHATFNGPAFWALGVLFLAAAVFATVESDWGYAGLFMGLAATCAALHVGLNTLRDTGRRKTGL